MPRSRIRARGGQVELCGELDEVLGLRTRDQHPAIDHKGASPELFLAEEMGDALALKASGEEGVKALAIDLAHAALGAREKLRLAQIEHVAKQQASLPQRWAERCS